MRPTAAHDVQGCGVPPRARRRVISSKIFVGNLDFGTSEQELRDFFAEAGEVVEVVIPTDRDTGRPRGFAFVRFGSDSQAQEAVQQLHGRELGGRELRLDVADDRPRPPRGDFGGGGGGFGGGGGGGGGFGGGGGPPRSFDRPAKPKGSRRGLRGKKRSL